MLLHKDSHTDHVPEEALAYVLELFKGRSGFFIEALLLPATLPAVRCDLHGPAVGEPPVLEDEAYYRPRPPREYPSRLCHRPSLWVRTLTVIAGPHDGLDCVLFTVFGGPLAPKEVHDPALKEEEREKSSAFWADHALSAEN